MLVGYFEQPSWTILAVSDDDKALAIKNEIIATFVLRKNKQIAFWGGGV